MSASQQWIEATVATERPLWRRLAVAFACVLAASLLRAALTAAIGASALPFVTFFPAVACAAWYGGLGPGLAALVLSAVVATGFLPDAAVPADVVGVAVFVMAAGIIVAAIEAMHRARRALAHGRDVLATTLTSIGDAVIVTDSSGRVTFLNPEAERLTGWSGREASGRRLIEVFRIVDERSRAVVEDPVTKVFREGTVVGLTNHTVLVARDGTETPIDDSAAPVRKPGHPTSGVVMVFRDVRAQRAADAARARLAAIVESSGDAIVAKDLDGTIRAWNAAAERLFGYRAEEIVGRPVTLLIPPERLAEEDWILQQLRAGSPAELIETVRVTKSGRRIPVSVRVSPLRDSAGEVVGASKIVRDLSELVAARDELAEERDLLATTLASIGDAVIATDEEGRVSFLNPVAESLTGWSQADAAGQPLVDVFRIVNETTREPVENPALRAMREGGIVGLANHTVLLARTGQESPIDDSAAPIRDGHGRIRGAVLVFRDVSARRLSQRALQHLEERSRSVIEHVVDGIITIDAGGRIDAFNRAAERLFGYAAGEVMGQNVRMLMPEPYRGEHDGYLRHYLQTGEARIIGIGREVVGLRKDGSMFPMELAVSEFEVGGQRHFTGIVRDISERRRSEAALQESEARFRLALEGTPVAVFNCDRELRYTWVHNAQPPLGGASALLGRRDDEILPAEAVAELVEMKTRVLGSGHGERRVVAIRHGRDTWYFDCAIEPTRDYAGDITGVRGAMADISQQRRVDVERERLRVELAAKVEELQTILDIAPVQIWFGDAECRTITGNRRAYEDHGLPYGINASFAASRSELPAGIRFEVAGRVLSPAEMPMQLAARTGRPVHNFEHDVVDSAGRRKTMWANVAPLFAADGAVRGVIGAYVDVTTLRAAERALREADERKNEFLATLAHELRNPLAPIRNSIALLQLKGPPDPELVAARGVIERQVQQLSRLLDDLLDVNRLARHKLQLRCERVTLANVVARALETARPVIEEGGHTVTVDVPGHLALDADPVRLAQVFANLLHNAAKYTERGGRIWLDARTEGAEVVVAVRDTGIGIPTEALPRLFEMFAQVPGSVDRAQGGIGVGLSLARNLVELHGGSIAAHSEGPGKGSEFVVRLPVAREPAAPAPAPARPAERPHLASLSRRILIADDVRDNADTLAMMLSALGHEVHVAYDGFEALAVAERVRPEVALLDIGMPRLNGYELCRRLREQSWGRRMYLIAQTGWGQEEDRRLAEEAGFDRHMLKPIDCAALVVVLANLPVATA